MVELRLLTEKARQTRYDFVWSVEGSKIPILEIDPAERALRTALEGMLYKWQYCLGRLR